jgi:adenine deaminase
METARLIEVAAGREPADVVLRNGHIVNVFANEMIDADVAIAGTRIAGVGRYEGRSVVDLQGQVVCPGFIDAHVHIESSMLAVPEFARLVSTRGTVAVITDPHEIANVMGTEGIRYMLASSKNAPLYVYVMLSSCVPASPLEGAGAELHAEDLEPLLADPWVLGLAEMMNFPGVVAADPAVLSKLQMCRGRVIDGHAPGLSGADLQAYVAAGIDSDHESTTLDEAREKLRLGLHIMIREGSQARNLSALLPLVTAETLDRFMFVTDDKDVEDLLGEGHIDHIIRKSVAAGLPPLWAVRIASFNAARYFGLRGQGAVAPGYLASLAIVDDLEQCRVRRVYHAGRLVAEDGVSVADASGGPRHAVVRNTMNTHRIKREHFRVPTGNGSTPRAHVIEMVEDQLVTGRVVAELPVNGGSLEADPRQGIAKIAVIDRHQASGRVGLGFIRGFDLKKGALASTVGHDAHNLVVVGMTDDDLYAAAVHTIRMGGGLCAVRDGDVIAEMALPVAGLMSDRPADEAASVLRQLHAVVRDQLGSSLRRPFMALSFMSLSVIGDLKVTDQGLVDVTRFEVIPLVH